MNSIPVQDDSIVIEGGPLRIAFDPSAGGFPSRVALCEQTGAETVLIENPVPPLGLVLEDGRTLRPVLAGKDSIRRTRTAEGAERIEFNPLAWADETGRLQPRFKLALRHEFWADGTAFSWAFFTAEDNHAPGIRRLALCQPLDLAAFDRVRWGLWPRPPRAEDGSFPYPLEGTERFLPPGKAREFKGQIAPLISFDAARREAPAVHVEYFMEGHNSLSGRTEHTATRVGWPYAGRAEICWEFQSAPCHSEGRPWQWQNQWGWVITPAPVRRRLPPLKLYHYIDKHAICPDPALLDKILAAHPDVLILHDPWRLDPQNGGFPYDPAAFSALVRKAHEQGVAIAAYIRGDELSGIEESLDWFDALLVRGTDGLYMDYGGPVTETQAPNERFPGGRIPFRRHYLKLRAYRRRIGPDGVFLSHTGPCFTALGMTGGTVDGYVSGEGEGGILVRGRAEHECFSGAYAVPGTLWTAAFPAYGTPRIVPFLAASAQAPHVPLGRQYVSSSLSHYPAPGINDAFARPLWKLWGLFRGERDLAVITDYNSYGTLRHDDPESGACLMVASDGRSALLILTQFTGRPRRADVRVDWAAAGLDPAGAAAWRFRPTAASPGQAEPCEAGCRFSADLEGWGLAGWLITRRPGDFAPRLAAYAEPYPPLDAMDREHLAFVARQREFREQGGAAPAWYLRVAVPETHALPHENSLYWDLYNNVQQLGVLAEDGRFRALTWIGRAGAQSAEPGPDERLKPGMVSAPIALREFLPAGRHRLAVRSLHAGQPSHSLVILRLSPNPDFKPETVLEFLNELEPDRSRIGWTCVLE